MPATATATTVTVENFTRAETDLYFGNAAIKEGAFGKLTHHREPMAIDKQLVIRANRDTLCSPGVFDRDAGPVTITLPDGKGRFRSMQVFDQDQHTFGVFYDAG